MRLPIQIQTIIFRKNNGKIEYLLLKRKKDKGDFWQPISGGLHGDETIQTCMLREAEEEANISKFKRIIENISFYQWVENNTYLKDKDATISEFVFGAEIEDDAEIGIENNPSEEHEKYEWFCFEEALKLLKWDDNKNSLKKLNEILQKEE